MSVNITRGICHIGRPPTVCRKFRVCKSNMTSAASKNEAWHISRGIVFAANARVMYPRLRPAAERLLHTTAELRLHVSAAGLDSVGSTREVGDEKALASESTASGAEDRPNGATEATDKRPAVSNLPAEDDGPDEPPFTPLDFTMSEEAFRSARLAEAGTPESFWSYTMYRGPSEDGTSEAKVKVHYCRSKYTTERVLQQYFKDEKVLGFDLEWAPDASAAQGPRRNISLVQLASPSRIALFHVALYPKTDDFVAPMLRSIMEDPKITKTGVSIKADCTRLKKFLGIDARGIFELSHLYKLVTHSSTGEYQLVNKKLWGLAKQVQEYLWLPMFKGQDVRSSDWSQPLKMDQIIYSASDAYAAVQLYATMDHHRKQLQPTPPLPYHAELNLPIRLADGISIATSDEIVDRPEAEEQDDAGPQQKLPAKYLKSMEESVYIEAEGDYSEPVLKQPPRACKSAATASPKQKNEKIEAAEAWLAQYRSANTKVRAAPAALRAYYIWNKDDSLDPTAIAALLRNPPLQENTVVSYILEAIRLEKLPFNKTRLRREVLDLLPESVVSVRYKMLLKVTEESK